MSQFDQIHIALFDEYRRYDEWFDARNRALLSCIDTWLTKLETAREDIEGIMVVVGSGSFTSTRIGVVVANTWSFARHIPLFAITEDQIDKAQDLIPELLKQTPGTYISATYSGEPNIGR